MRVSYNKANNQYFGKDFEKVVYKKLSGVELPLSGKINWKCQKESVRLLSSYHNRRRMEKYRWCFYAIQRLGISI